ncbi:hypothetical protein SAMD00019534_040910 [Acytostelium subglobosum LB1]|uniref:hypothetical protein n=1 Tax=Acytostelium subglobosum LB1 TaxID=1410327 RepID=UPI000644B92A|nr:hypothetical protein SAMD00019534_040910 [Acytostelium subglobosum LB1]GAM20916.1 hypothetical protein SAMD00019534_040910 [Acytostelium subglobosum LB1]|eukprot:XP_012756050.1 hypothetical protein SAMD00019534_040910 [Acytostelium subglobosum LB1]
MAVVMIKRFKFTSQSFMIIMEMEVLNDCDLVEGNSFLGPSERTGTLHPIVSHISFPDIPFKPTNQWLFDQSTSIDHKLQYLSIIPKLGCLPDKLVTHKQDIFNTIVSSLVTDDLLLRHGNTISYMMEQIGDVIDNQSNQQRLIDEISERPTSDQAFVVFSPFIRSFHSPYLIDCFKRLLNVNNMNALIKLIDIDLFIHTDNIHPNQYSPTHRLRTE